MGKGEDTRYNERGSVVSRNSRSFSKIRFCSDDDIYIWRLSPFGPWAHIGRGAAMDVAPRWRPSLPRKSGVTPAAE